MLHVSCVHQVFIKVLLVTLSPAWLAVWALLCKCNDDGNGSSSQQTTFPLIPFSFSYLMSSPPALTKYRLCSCLTPHWLVKNSKFIVDPCRALIFRSFFCSGRLRHSQAQLSYLESLALPWFHAHYCNLAHHHEIWFTNSNWKISWFLSVSKLKQNQLKM